MIRLHVIAEGQTEESFVRSLLTPHLGAFQIATDVRCVATGYSRGRLYKGGLIDYAQARADIVQWLKNDARADSRFSTMFDLYALPNDFPGYLDAPKEPYARVAHLEQALQHDIGDLRFVPYIQLHEFEALLFARIEMLEVLYMHRKPAIEHLAVMSAAKNPELINEGRETAPSKRILREIPEYSKIGGVTVLEQIGLPCLLEKCQHFREWVEGLEGLSFPPIRKTL